MGKTKEPCIYVTGIKQFSWNDKTKSGSFTENTNNPDKKVQIKLDEKEIAGLIYAVENGKEFKAFHSFEETKTQILFKPYRKGNGDDAFSFTLTRNSTEKFGIGVEVSEAQLLIEFCKYTLRYLFNHRENEYQKKREAVAS